MQLLSFPWLCLVEGFEGDKTTALDSVKFDRDSPVPTIAFERLTRVALPRVLGVRFREVENGLARLENAPDKQSPDIFFDSLRESLQAELKAARIPSLPPLSFSNSSSPASSSASSSPDRLDDPLSPLSLDFDLGTSSPASPTSPSLSPSFDISPRSLLLLIDLLGHSLTI